MARVIENGRSFKGLVFFEQGAKGYGGLTIVVVARALTKNKIWEWYGKAWAICGPYVGIVWEG